jgi:3'-phosphoadenosine 5'-phosphosulfate sulfotransferase
MPVTPGGPVQRPVLGCRSATGRERLPSMWSINALSRAREVAVMIRSPNARAAQVLVATGPGSHHRFLIDNSSNGGVAMVVATTMNTAAAYVPASTTG